MLNFVGTFKIITKDDRMCETNDVIVRISLSQIPSIYIECDWIFGRFCSFHFSLPIATGAIYVRKYFNSDAKNAITQLVHSIHDELLNTLHTVSWMDNKTRGAAIAKALAMHFHIAYANELIDDDKLQEHYNGLDLHADSLLHSIMEIRKFRNKHLVEQLRTPINKTDWETHSMITAVNAFYSHTENSIRRFRFWKFQLRKDNWLKKYILLIHTINNVHLCLQDCRRLLFKVHFSPLIGSFNHSNSKNDA